MGRKRSKFSDEELLEIYAKPLQVWPTPDEHARSLGFTKPQPLPWQRPALQWEYDYARRLAHENGMHCHQKDCLLAYGARGPGKCQKKDTPIIMYDGTIKLVQDIKVGDLLMGPDSKPRKVVGLGRGREEMFKITPINGDSYTFNKSHILSFKTSGLRLSSKRTGPTTRDYVVSNGDIVNMSIEDYLNLPKYKREYYKLWRPDFVDFPNSQELPIDPYFIGLWLGDGTSKSAEITTMDLEIVAYLNKLANSLGMSVRSVAESGKSQTYSIQNNERLRNSNGTWANDNYVVNCLRSLGVLGNKHLPHTCLTASKEHRLKILAGLIDSDGSVADNYIEITQKSKVLSEGIVFLARSLGFAATIKECQKSCTYKGEKRTGTYYRMTIYGEGLENIPTLIPRKKLNPRKLNRNSRLTGFEIESVGEDDYYGFELEGPDSLYLLGDFTVTHNTRLGIYLNIFFLTNVQECETVCGAKTYTDAEEIVIKHYKDIFTIKEPFDHPFIEHVPNIADKDLVLEIPYVGLDSFGRETIIFRHSVCHLFHFSDWGRLRGKEYVYAHMEELSQLDEEITLDEIERSIRSAKSPLRMLYAATNPPKSRSHFMYDRWDLTAHMPNFTGEKPKPIVCKCQFCQKCLDAKQGDWIYDESGFCTNPNCVVLELSKKLGADATRYKRPTYSLSYGHKSNIGKELYCPGNQPFWRVIHCKTEDNFCLPPTLIQELKASQDEANFAMFTEGQILDLGVTKAFPAFSFDYNTNSQDVPISIEKDIHWSHDHNTRPRCSIIAQEYPQPDNEVLIQIVDGIVMFDTHEPVLKEEGLKLVEKNPALQLDESFIEKYRVRGVGPEHVAQEFVKRYKEWNELSEKKRTVFLHGDHTALNAKMSPFSKNEFQVIHDILVDAGFNVEICVKKMTNEKIQINVADRLAVTNWMLRDKDGRVRIRINRGPQGCKYLLKSLEDTEKIVKDKEAVDKKCDELAAKATNTKKLHLVTHSAEALGYYLVRRFNLIKVPEGFKFLYVPGQPVLHFDDKGSTYYSDEDKAKEEEKISKAERDAQLLIDLIRAETSQSDDWDAYQRFRNYFG